MSLSVVVCLYVYPLLLFCVFWFSEFWEHLLNDSVYTKFVLLRLTSLPPARTHYRIPVVFKAELLSPQKQMFNTIDCFKMTNFTSLNRQLNLYRIQHHFHNPNFKQDPSELLVNLKRLTSKNKAKMEAAQEVNCRSPKSFRRLMANGEEEVKVEKRVHRLSPYQQYNQSRIQTMKEYDRTPIPPRGCIMGHGDAPSPTTIYTDKGIPISVIHHFPSDTSCSVQSSPTTAHIQQGSQSLANPRPKFNSFIPHHDGFYSPALLCQCSPLGSTDSNCHSVHQTTPSYSHYSYYQKAKKSDVNLDTVFQIVDELHHSSPKIRMVKVSPHTVTVSSQIDSSVNSSFLPGTILMDASTVTPRGSIIITVPVNIPSQGIAIMVGGHAAEQPVKREEEPLPVDAIQKVNNNPNYTSKSTKKWLIEGSP
uniref:Uncharacterized protein n=1 Tax=Salmo trutta TaxID=8032 RepID=A0A673YV20_SALTR